MIETRQVCGHLLYWRNLTTAPKPGERIYCAHEDCLDMRVVESRTGTWFGRCRDCTASWAYASVEKLAEKVGQHASDREHAVSVWDHDRTQHLTVRTKHAAAQLVADPATTREKGSDRSRMALQRTHDTLF